jgi:hypothetical protein
VGAEESKKKAGGEGGRMARSLIRRLG